MWAPIKGAEGGTNNYIWAPISQEELFLENLEKKKEKDGKKSVLKKLTKSASMESVRVAVPVVSKEVEEQEVSFINDEEEVTASSGTNR